MDQKRLDMYRGRMQEITYRLDVVKEFSTLRENALYLPTTVECVYLQLRNTLELIATASLVVNEDAKDVLSKEGRKKWHAGDILEAVETVNPDYYYPKPTRLVAKNKGSFVVGADGYRGEWEDFKGDYLTREKFTTLYDICSRVVHSPNPFDRRALARSSKIDKKLLIQAQKWHERIINLLTHHHFKLVGEEGMLYVCHTVGPNAEFEIASFQRMDGLGENSTPEAVAAARAKFLSSTDKSSEKVGR